MSTQLRTSRISTRIADGIRREIARGALRSGDRLPPERTMVKRHRVSRVSVREAYRALEDTGVVTVRRGATGGAFVSTPGPTPLGEALGLALILGEASERQVREASLVEPLVAALAARHATTADLVRLRKAASVPARSIRPGEFEPHRVRFHLAVADAARNVALAALVRSIATASEPLYGSLDQHDGFIDTARRWHRVIGDAIAGRDEAAASGGMREYLLWLNERSLRHSGLTLPAP